MPSEQPYWLRRSMTEGQKTTFKGFGMRNVHIRDKQVRLQRLRKPLRDQQGEDRREKTSLCSTADAAKNMRPTEGRRRQVTSPTCSKRGLRCSWVTTGRQSRPASLP
ncbi:MAG: hypothetical protein MZV63_27750 [Marinilabiliales bacterium]|nr:hypothetical protein [Marinilabiliales bacterium]